MIQVELHPKLLLIYSEITDGNLDERFSPPKEVRQHRTSLLAPFRLTGRDVIEAAQIHSDRLLSLNGDNAKMWRGVNVTGVDGFITKEPDVAMLIKVADCVPVAIYDPVNHAAGLFHAGFEGTNKGIHTTGLARMQREFNTDPSQVLVWLGPSARSCHYVLKTLPSDLDQNTWGSFITSADGVFHPDLVGYLIATLKQAGVKASHIKDSRLCTVDNPSFFSHQRSQTTGEPEGRIGIVLKLL